MDELITVEELVQQIWEIEGVVVEVFGPNRLVRPYNYGRLPDTSTVQDLMDRVSECLKPFIYFIDKGEIKHVD